MFNKIKFRNRVLDIPIIQGGMGIGVSLSKLAGNVMKQGCMGVLSFAQPGYKSDNFYKNTIEENFKAMEKEVAKAYEIASGKGLLAVNVMVAGRDYEKYVRECVRLKVDAIISGAGLPLNLPKLTEKSDVLLAPIVSSSKALRLILKSWDLHYDKVPDFIVIEGIEAGGHLGFKKDDIYNNQCEKLEDILSACLKQLLSYEEKYQRKIPVFVAGGIYDGKDIAHFIKLGASGVQMGTRFIATDECDIHDNFKKMIIDAKQEEIVIVKSPTGFLGRAIKNNFVAKLEKLGKIPVKRCVNCLMPCNPKNTIYCISEALINAAKGDMQNGLFFCGSKGYMINKIMSVKSLIDELVASTKMELKKIL